MRTTHWPLGWLPLLAWSCLALAADPAPAPKAFEMKLLKIGDTYQGLKFSPGTGEAWQIAVDKWEKIPEGEAPPPGDYQVTLIPSDNGFLALRFERTNGATWLLLNRKWNRIKEPAGAKPPAAEKNGKGYALVHARVGDQLHVVRYHRASGEAARIAGDAYQLLPETGAVPVGDFDVTMMTTNDKWMAFRFNNASGATWLLRDNKWWKVADPE